MIDRSAFAAIVREAGATVRAAFGGPLASACKSDGSPVTEVDRSVDAFLHEKLSGLLPDAGWLSEETADDARRLSLPTCWIVDPIDGTSQLLRGIPELSISVALVRDGEPVAAAVLNPMSGEEGIWTEGEPPAFRGLTPSSAGDSLDAIEAIVSRTESESGELARVRGVVRSFRPVGSVAYKLLRVAARADAVTFSLRPKSEWDVCAGIALVEAAGGVYVRLDDRPVRFNQAVPVIPSGAVAGPAGLAEALADRLRRR
ncbi:MAG TPA: 3'(2'),5'-bisphosphate nucleotidase CysQ [Candidatus Polarisedimenticolaceae bacterium]|nr:3'(2'),5'-bisphosphate nucleotidase CysQ [Candidatus Polarisedimenticolaceae bacterium]